MSKHPLDKHLVLDQVGSCISASDATTWSNPVLQAPDLTGVLKHMKLMLMANKQMLAVKQIMTGHGQASRSMAWFRPVDASQPQFLGHGHLRSCKQSMLQPP